MIITRYLRAISAFVMLTIAALSLAGCQFLGPSETKDSDMISISHEAAKNLMTQSKNRLEPGQMILTSFANIDDLTKYSKFGRIVAQQVGSGFSSQGHHGIELLLRDTVYIGVKEGEFLLSRALRDLSVEHDAQAAIVGTYAVGVNNVYVTTKVIRASDSVVLASEDFVLPLGPDMKKMVATEK